MLKIDHLANGYGLGPYILFFPNINRLQSHFARWRNPSNQTREEQKKANICTARNDYTIVPGVKPTKEALYLTHEGSSF